jgi:hypothetical protein
VGADCKLFRLLEAQIATGGLIDPHAGHRIPIETARQRGLFDERLQRILEDPSDDTRVYFLSFVLAFLAY